LVIACNRSDISSPYSVACMANLTTVGCEWCWFRITMLSHVRRKELTSSN
jgi:hypothetical protein